MKSKANQTRTILLKSTHNEIVKYLKTHNTCKINGQTPHQRFELFDKYEIQIDNPIITGIGIKHKSKMLLRKGISNNNFNELISKLPDGPSSNGKEELDTYINKLDERKILFSKKKLHNSDDNTVIDSSNTFHSTNNDSNNKDIVFSFKDIKRDFTITCNQDNKQHQLAKKGMLVLKRIVTSIKNTHMKNKDKRRSNKLVKVFIESPDHSKNTSSFSSTECSKSLSQKNENINMNSCISPLKLAVVQNSNNINNAYSSFALDKIKRTYKKKNTFMLKTKIQSDFKIDLIRFDNEQGVNHIEQEGIFLTKTNQTKPICVFGTNNDISEEILIQISQDGKRNTSRASSEHKQKVFKKSKTNIVKKSYFLKQSKLMEHLSNLYLNQINDSSEPE